jgi:aminoglycoside phosphotransferase (APT) family kinase protein
MDTMIRRAFPKRRISRFEVLSGGLINTNLRIHFENDESAVVLRIYRDGADACRKEAALHRLVQEHVPVAKIIHAEPDGIEASQAFSILEYIDGITFQQLQRTKQREAIAEAAYSAGRVLGAVGRYQFEEPGQILIDNASGELMIGERFVDANHQVPEMVDLFLASPTLRKRISHELIAELSAFFREWSADIEQFIDDRNLVHCDFGNRNVLVNNKNGRWEIAAILDWELAISGSPLMDVGNFLRYDYATPVREPHFSRAFVEHGGRLPDDWQNIVRVFDLSGLVECLTHDRLPPEVEAEIVQLIHATLAT